jgi:hypothetical protein
MMEPAWGHFVEGYLETWRKHVMSVCQETSSGRVSLAGGMLSLEEVVLWPERTDAHVGGSRDWIAIGICLRCKPFGCVVSGLGSEELAEWISARELKPLSDCRIPSSARAGEGVCLRTCSWRCLYVPRPG